MPAWDMRRIAISQPEYRRVVRLGWEAVQQSLGRCRIHVKTDIVYVDQ